MYILTGHNPNKNILLTYDIHRTDQIYFLNFFLEFKKLFNNYQFFAEFIGDFSTELCLEEWAKTDNIEQPFDENLKKCFSNHDGVIGFELPRNMINFLKNANIPYINYNNSVYRCAENLHLALETNLNLSNIYYPQKPRHNSANLDIGTLLVGQIKYDRSLIKNNNFISLINYENIIKSLPKPIYFTTHPLGNSDLYLWSKINNFIITDKTTYSLLESKPKLVCGVSSSVLYEARDLWKLPVLFLNEKEYVRNFINLPYEVAFDHDLINAILDNDEINTKIIIADKMHKYLNK